MPEEAAAGVEVSRTDGAPGGVLPATAEADAGPVAARAAGVSWFFYGLGLSLQVFLWFLLFLAIVIAVAVGGQLTEFRYVGF